MLFVAGISHAQTLTEYNQLIPFDENLNRFAFEDIREYVIDNGDRKTYCPNYKNNPHYKIENTTIELYLNPTNQDNKEPAISDYNVMYIIDEDKSHFYIYLAPDKKVYLYDYDNQLVNHTIRKNKVFRAKQILNQILQKIDI